MKENEKYQKLDLAAMLEDVQKGHSPREAFAALIKKMHGRKV